mmetsp:Transcript_21409/g.50971  ORF Transcript_21409/g.50971 Transcript_21409/m.50971 type:complete len:127 (+) Transcript_21409:561-941(+)
MERDAPGITTAISTDPGRFVCNYVYCKSLEVARPYSGPHRTPPSTHSTPTGKIAGSGTTTTDTTSAAIGNRSVATGDDVGTRREMDAGFRCESLFLHVPHFSIVPEDEQVAYVAALIKNLAEERDA